MGEILEVARSAKQQVTSFRIWFSQKDKTWNAICGRCIARPTHIVSDISREHLNVLVAEHAAAHDRGKRRFIAR